MESAGVPSSGGRLLLAGLVGALVALSLGIYGNVHDPASDLSITLGFTRHDHDEGVAGERSRRCSRSSRSCRPLWMYGKLPLGDAPEWIGGAAPDLRPARVPAQPAGRLPLPLPARLPGHSSARVLAHSLLGCAFYGAFAAKVVIVRSRGLPGIALPIAGGLAVHAPRRGLADERAVVHLRERLPVALTCCGTIDRILAPLTWLAAAFAVLVLLVGPTLIGAKKDEPHRGRPRWGSRGARRQAALRLRLRRLSHARARRARPAASGPNLDDAEAGRGDGRGDRELGSGIDARLQGAAVGRGDQRRGGVRGGRRAGRRTPAATRRPASATPAAVTTVRTDRGPDGITIANGRVWVANATAGTLLRIDAAAGRRLGRPLAVGRQPDNPLVDRRRRLGGGSRATTPWLGSRAAR